MNEQPYKAEHLREYIGILTSTFSNGKFKMELKVEDNPVLKERWTKKKASSIELNFYYNLGPSSSFSHHIFSCPKYSKQEQCADCDNIIGVDEIFETNLKRLQIGDTFSINAALINNKQSVLPAEIHSFENYQPLLVTCTEYWLRLDDTPEGINKKQELEKQKLQREADEKASLERRQNKEKWENRWNSLERRLAKRPYITRSIIIVLLTTLANQIPNIVKFVKYLFNLWFPGDTP